MIVKCQKINNNIMKMKQKVWYRIKNLLILKIKIKNCWIFLLFGFLFQEKIQNFDN